MNGNACLRLLISVNSTMKTKIIVLLIILCFSLYFLFLKTEVLGLNLFGAEYFPVGSVIAWICILAYNLLLQIFLKRNTSLNLYKVYKFVLRFQLLSVCLWLPMSYVLSGNWSFTFRNRPFAFYAWLVYTLSLILIPLLLLFIKFLYKFLSTKR